jgi:hypothetical protein
MDVEASRAIRQAEVGASRTMIERTAACFGIKPEWLVGDTAYGSAPNLNWLVNEQKIAPYIPVVERSKREDGVFSREDFAFDEERDIYICPAGKVLTTTGTVVNDDQVLYRAAGATAGNARSKCNAARRNRCAKFRATSTRKLARSPGRMAKPKPTSDRAVIAKKLRCCLPT